MTKKRQRGRPTKFTPETRKRIIEALEVGMPKNAACASAGVDYRTFAYWQERGLKAKSGEFLHFVQALKMAEDRGIAFLLSIVIKAARGTDKKGGNWVAAMTMLERLHPAQFGRIDKMSAEVRLSGGVNVRASEDELVKLIQSDPEARDAAQKLLELTSHCSGNADGAGGLCQQHEVEDEPAPEHHKSKAP